MTRGGGSGVRLLVVLAALAVAAPLSALQAPSSAQTSHGMMGQGMMGRGAGERPQPPSGPASKANAAGAEVFASQCAMCHTLGTSAPHGVGPNLHGLFGRPAGSVPGYAYSRALRRSGLLWSRKTLDAFLTDPARLLPGSKMSFPGIRDPEERKDLIDYLEAATR